MKLRQLGYRAQELEAGPYRFLISDSVPVAYNDGLVAYRSQEFFSKATTRHQNTWLGDIKARRVPHQAILDLFEALDRFQPERRLGDRRQIEQRTVPLMVRGHQP